MKKLVCMLLAIIMVISLAACGAKTDTGTAAPLRVIPQKPKHLTPFAWQ